MAWLTRVRLAAKIIQGFFATPVESLIEVSIADVVGVNLSCAFLLFVCC